jgi:hypothetical protein
MEKSIWSRVPVAGARRQGRTPEEKERPPLEVVSRRLMKNVIDEITA